MGIDWFGIEKWKEHRISIEKSKLARQIDEAVNQPSQGLIQNWDESEAKDGREPRVSYRTLESLYRRESWVRACIDVIARTATSNGFRLIPCPGIEDSQITDREIEPILSLLEEPNPNDTFSEIIAEVCIDLHLYGDAYVEVVLNKTTNTPESLYNLYAPSLRVLVDKHGTVLGYLQMVDSKSGRANATPIVFRPEEVVHFRLPNPGNEVYGLSPLESLFTPIETDLLAQEYNKKFFQNHATPKLHVDLGTCTLSQLKRTREYFAFQLKGVSNAHKTLITEGGATIKVIGIYPSDMEFLNQRKFSRDEICAVIGVPPMKIGIFEDVNRASAVEADKSFKSEKIIPLQRMISKKLNLNLISLFDARVQFEFVELDLRDALEQSEINKVYLETGVLTVDEVRVSLGLKPKKKSIDNQDTTDPESEEVENNLNISAIAKWRDKVIR